MDSFCAQLVVFVTSFVLALPSGWCSGWMRHSQDRPAPAKAACCHQDQSCDPQEVPAKGAIECCCSSWQATVPQKSVPSANASGMAVPVFVARLTPDLGRLAAESLVDPIP